jgi:transposase
MGFPRIRKIIPELSSKQQPIQAIGQFSPPLSPAPYSLTFQDQTECEHSRGGRLPLRIRSLSKIKPNVYTPPLREPIAPESSFPRIKRGADAIITAQRSKTSGDASRGQGISGAHRRRLVGIQAMTRNRLQSLLHCHMLELPSGPPRTSLGGIPSPFLPLIKPPSPLPGILDHLRSLTDHLDAQIVSLSDSPKWRDSIHFVLQIPGFGVNLGLTILSAIGDISRYPSPKKLVAYAGLGASIHDSDHTHRTGKITKTGRRDLRTALMEAAWSAVNSDPYWKQEFDRLSQRLFRCKVIVAIARRMLVILWHVLSKRQPYRHISEVQIASKMLRWSWEVRKHNPKASASRLLIHRRLITLGVGRNLSRFTYHKLPRALASEEEGLALTL